MRFCKRLGRAFAGRDDGVASVEFVIAVPILFTIFMASFESGLLMVRSILLEQSVDRVIREVRLGHLPNATHGSLKTEICELTAILQDCQNSLMLEMVPISQATWAVPTNRAACVDRAQPIDPNDELDTGGANEVMLVRACILQNPIFPTTGIGLNLRYDESGAYGLLASSAFVNEPL